MGQEQVDSVYLGGSADLDLSLMGLFLAADPVVKAVIVGLLLTSVWTWAIIINKSIRMRRLRRRTRSFEDSFWAGGSLDALYDRVSGTVTDPMSVVFSAAMREWRRSASLGLIGKGEQVRASLRMRIEQIMTLTISREMEALERNMTFLASVGATAPFIGLFGTVWGIMGSFQSIAATKTTALSVVAPGIAEALFATALGLVAAIPAVIAYNKISQDLDRFAQHLERFSGDFISILSRQLDEGA